MLLHLKDHCIETAAKQERRRVVAALLDVDESSEAFRGLADDLDLVTGFLESHDFRKLRSERPELAGGRDLYVELTRAPEEGRFALIVVGTPRAETR
jgi:hypothetical protein